MLFSSFSLGIVRWSISKTTIVNHPNFNSLRETILFESDNFYPIIPIKDKSIFHTNPEELLSLMRDLKVKKVVGMHWGTAILSLEPIWEPPKRFKTNAKKFGYNENDAVLFKIGEIKKLSDLIN